MEGGVRMVNFLKVIACMSQIVLSYSLLGNTIITNDFGICYDSTAKTFSLKSTYKKHLCCYKKKTALFSSSGRMKEEKAFTAINVERINRHFYKAQLQEKSLGLTQRDDLILFKYSLDRMSPKMRYGILEFAEGIKQDNAIAIGEYLIAETIDSQLSDIVCHNGKIADMSSGGIMSSDIYDLGKGKYLFRQRIPFIEHTNQRYFLADSEKGKMEQVPLFMVHDHWNNIAYGAYVDDNDCNSIYDTSVVFCFYNLITGQKIDFPEEFVYDKMVVTALMINADEIVVWCGENKEVGIYDGYFKPKRVDYTYERHRNILIQQRGDGSCKILNVKDEILWTFVQNTCEIKLLNLDNDYKGEYEALICSTLDQIVLVDCSNGTIHKADEIEHVGLGFFRLVNDGKEEWVTL